MTLLASSLEKALSNLPTVSTEADAISNIGAAYGTYAKAATAGTTPGPTVSIIPLAVATAQSIMQAAPGGDMSGLSASGNGATALFNGIVAFWASIAKVPGTSFATATLVTPPPMAGLVAALTVVFAANTSGSLSLSAATAAVADAIHAQTIIGGTVTIPGSPPVVLPIL